MSIEAAPWTEAEKQVWLGTLIAIVSYGAHRGAIAKEEMRLYTDHATAFTFANLENMKHLRERVFQ